MIDNYLSKLLLERFFETLRPSPNSLLTAPLRKERIFHQFTIRKILSLWSVERAQQQAHRLLCKPFPFEKLDVRGSTKLV